MGTRVLVVDDDQNTRRMICAILNAEGFETADADSGAAALPKADAFEPHVMLLDLIMPPGPDGLTTLEQCRARFPEVVVVMMSGKASLADAVRATRMGAFQFLEKPLTPEGVIVTVGAAAEFSSTKRKTRALRDAQARAHAIVGSSDAIGVVRSLVAQVAPTPSRVLITGESGTGKELVARAIHAQSPRADNPMISVNSAAIPRELLESELFGHERGAFTGAVERRAGKFELADSGTLFLDEVGDLESGAQAKLLRALETGTIERVGGTRVLALDVRIIAATNRRLELAVRNREFREDLFYRLNVFPIDVPPLRSRPGDVPELLTHFAHLVAGRLGRAPVTFTGGAVEHLTRHSWPGNVRELANIVERLAIVAPDGRVTAPQVDGVLGVGRIPPAAPKADGGLNGLLAAYERSLILHALRHAHGNVADAARALNTDRANLYRRLRRLDIDPTDTRVSK
jgi:two-component system nitrogen regulation response regulator NtrX